MHVCVHFNNEQTGCKHGCAAPTAEWTHLSLLPQHSTLMRRQKTQGRLCVPKKTCCDRASRQQQQQQHSLWPRRWGLSTKKTCSRTCCDFTHSKTRTKVGGCETKCGVPKTHSHTHKQSQEQEKKGEQEKKPHKKKSVSHTHKKKNLESSVFTRKKKMLFERIQNL